MRELDRHGLKDHVRVDSAGTHVFKTGHRPDKRAQQVAEHHGVQIKKLKARNITREDFERFDYIVAMDHENLHSLKDICPPEYQNKLFLILEFAPQSGQHEVPDPYFGNLSGFERVLELLEIGCDGLLSHIKETHQLIT